MNPHHPQPRKDSASVVWAFDELLKENSAFYRSVSEELSRIAAKKKVPPDAVADVVQKAWLQAVQNRDKFEGENIEPRLRGWLHEVVWGQAVDWLRREGRHRHESLDKEGVEFIDHGQARRTEAAEQKEELWALLARVRADNEMNHHLVCEHFLNQQSFKDLAAQFKRTENAIACRIRRRLAYLCGLAKET